jgi:hypothetical protein
MESHGFEKLIGILDLSCRYGNIHLAANNEETAEIISLITGLQCLYLPNLVPVNTAVEVKFPPPMS